MQAKNYSAAIDAFTKSSELDSNYSLPLVNRGLAKEQLADYSGAIADFTQATKLQPDYGALDNRARLELKIGEYSNALNDYTRLLTIYSEPQCRVKYYHERAIAKEHLKDKAGATEDRDKEKKLRSILK